jgi:hypothetical protein
MQWFDNAYCCPQTYVLYVMHYAPHIPASHGGSNAKAMQHENYAGLHHAL